MVDLTALAVVGFVATLGVLFGIPRAIGSGTGTDGAGWPDVLAGLDQAQERWIATAGVVDIVGAILGLVVLVVGLRLFLDPTTLGIQAESVFARFGMALIVIGVGLIGSMTHVRIRRSGLSNAEAALIGGVVGGMTLSIAVLFALLQQG